MDIANDIFYKHGKSQYNIFITGYTKRQNLKFKEYTYSYLHVCHLCAARNTKDLKLIFYMFVRYADSHDVTRWYLTGGLDNKVSSGIPSKSHF